MAEIGQAWLSVLPSAAGFGKKLESEVSGETRGTGKKVGASFGTAFKVGAAAVVGGGLLAAGFLKGAVSDAREAQKVTAATNAIIKATGGVAKVSAAQVADLSGALAAKTGVDDGQIAAGANLLLTFKNVRKEGEGLEDIFKRATVAGLDLAAAGFGSVEGNALQLGKALNDPLKGITALSRSGVTFTEVQKEQIKGFVESNDLLSAQKIILGEVEAQVGGTAAATATAGEKAAFAFGEIKESIGTALLPVVDQLANAFVKLAPKIQTTVETITKAFSYLFGGGEEGARGFAEILDNAFGNTGKFIAPITAVTEAFQIAFAAAARVRAEIADRLSPVFSALGGFISRNPELVRNFAIALGVLVGAIGAVTLATTAFSIALNTTGIPLVIIGVAALAAGLIYAYQHSEGFRTAVQSLATTFQTSVLPALQSMWTYFQTNIIPVFIAIGAVIRDQVLPIIRSFALFVIGTLIPAIVRIATQIGSNLAPIFKQLVATFKSQVLPALQLLLAKFKEYQPAIQAVIAIVVKVIGKYLEFAAAILGKVLPPVIRFAGFLIGTVVPSVVATINVGEQIIKTAIAIGRAFLDAVKDVARFATGVRDKVAEAISYVRGIPGKITAAIGNLGSLLFNAGAELVQGLINGITSKISALGSKMAELGNKIKGFLPGSPVKDGPLKSWNDGKGGVSAAGARLMDGLAKGIADGGPKVADKMREAMQKVVDALESKRDRIKSTLDGFKSDFALLRDSIASTFTGNLFEATNSQDFFANLLGKKADLTGLKKAFAKLRGYGLDPKFLSQLFASGNGALILDLAAGPKSDAGLAQSLFNDTNSLAASLGNQVAQPDVGPKIDRTNAQLAEMNKRIKGLAAELAQAVNQATVNGNRGRAA